MNKRVYSTKIAAELCRLGFKIVRTVPNPKKPWLTSYLFENTPELLEALNESVEMSNSND